MPDETWKRNVESDMKSCLKHRIKLEENTKSQQKEIDENRDFISELYDYKNKLFQKITVLEVQKRFLPWLISILSAAATIGLFLWTIYKSKGG